MSAAAAQERVDRARVAQRTWAALRIHQRIARLATLRRAIARDREAIVAAVVADTGKPELDALSGDVLVTLEQMLTYERTAAPLLRRKRVGKSRLLFAGCAFTEEREPFGVALIYGPSNYPFQLTMVPAATALYAGNTVVLKASERTPRVAQIIERLATETLPPDVLQVVRAEPAEAGDYIDANPDLVFFTGSSANGRKVAARAAARLIPSVLELGGKDAAIVFADCAVARTVDGVAYGAFSNAGQVCVGIKRLFVEAPIYRDFIFRLRERVQSLRIGAGTECDLGHVVDDGLKERLRAQVADALAQGATLEAGGGDCDRPTVLADVPRHAKLMTEETFGPVLCVAPFTNEDEAVTLANDCDFALSASVWTGDLARGRRIASRLAAGSCAVNDVIRTIANPHSGFGGNRSSGYGRYHGPEGLMAFSRTKTVMTVRPWQRREMHWFPFTAVTRSALGKLIELRHRPRGWGKALRSLLRPMSVALLCAVVAGASAQSVSEGHLRLDVIVPANGHGKVAWAVYNSADGFPGERSKALRRGFSSDVQGNADVQIDAGALPAGHYAVAVYIDENGDGKLDYKLFGLPREPVGASNNPAPRMGPPRFRDCVFALGAGNKTIQIRLVNPR